MAEASSEWTTVTKSNRKRVTRRSKQKVNPKKGLQSYGSLSTVLTEQQLQTSLDVCIQEIEGSDFFRSLEEHLFLAETTPSYEDIVCYGIGNFSYGPASTVPGPLWQLACACRIRKAIIQNSSGTAVPSMWYFDPCMTGEEEKFLLQNSFHIIQTNERGNRSIENDARTLFFMPHCPMTLYSNLLWTNWEALQHMVIVGNSLLDYADRLLPEGDAAKFGKDIIQALAPCMIQESMRISPDDIKQMRGYFENAFNDTVVVRFEDKPTLDKPTNPHGFEANGEVI